MKFNIIFVAETYSSPTSYSLLFIALALSFSMQPPELVTNIIGNFYPTLHYWYLIGSKSLRSLLINLNVSIAPGSAVSAVLTTPSMSMQMTGAVI